MAPTTTTDGTDHHAPTATTTTTTTKLENVRRPTSTEDTCVLAARAVLERSLHLQGLPSRLTECSRRLNEARACSTPFAEVRAELTAAGRALARASEGARAACLTFVKCSQSALDDLDDARDLLVVGAARTALVSLKSTRIRARKVAEYSRGVADDLGKAADMVSKAEHIARNLHLAQSKSKAEQIRRSRITRLTLEDARERRLLAREDVSEAHTHYLSASLKERSAITRANVAHAAQLIAVVGAAAGTRSPKLAMREKKKQYFSPRN